MKTETAKNKTGNNKAQLALADLNSKIAELEQQKAALAEPLKGRYGELRTELLEMENQIRELDPAWKPAPLKPKADTRIVEILTANEKPMTADEIIKAIGEQFTAWKIKNTLKKKSQGAKATFAVNDGRYSLKAAA